MANATKLTWQAPATWSDDVTPFKQSDFKGWLVEVDGNPAVGVPAAWETDGTYEFPIASIPSMAAIGKHTIDMKLVSVDPKDASKILTSQASASVTYVIDGAPKPPLAVAVA